MALLFLLLIYIAFISLGLPDSILGASWPIMRPDLGAGLGTAGVIAMIVSACTIAASLASDRLTRRFGAGKVTAVSVLLTAVALLGFGLAPSVAWLFVLALPLGLGAGSVDAALNNYVALHYSARHMSWLHCFWGVGAFVGPMLLSLSMNYGGGWRGGYLIIAGIQFFIVILLFLSLPAWRRRGDKPPRESGRADPELVRNAGLPAYRIPGALFAMATFAFYCAAEASTGLWSSSFLVERRGFSTVDAALAASVYFAGITGGRFLNGFLAERFSGAFLIRAGLATLALGVLLLALPLPGPFAYVSLLLAGLGCAPIYPVMIHETPRRFGAAVSQRIIGLQMASAYCGTTFFPPLLGLIAGWTGLWILPFFLFLFVAGMLFCSEAINRRMRGRE